MTEGHVDPGAERVELRPLLVGALAAPAGVLVGLGWSDGRGTVALGLAGLLLAAALVVARSTWRATLAVQGACRAGLGALALALGLLVVASSAGVSEGPAVALANLVAAPGLVLVLPAVARLPARQARRALLAAVALGAGLRLLLVLAAPHGQVTSDAPSYTGPAMAWLRGEGFPLHPYRTPGYPWFVCATTWAGGLLGQRVLNALLLGPACAAMAHLALARVGVVPGVRVAVVAWLLLCPDLLLTELQLMSEPLFCACALAGVLASLAAAASPRGDLRWAAAAGAVLAAATLVRPSGQPLILLALVGLALRVRPWGRGAASAAVCAASFAGPIAAWCLRNLAVHGAARLSFLSGITLLGSAAPGLPLDRPPHLEVKRAIADDVRWYRETPPGGVLLFLFAPGVGIEPKLKRFAPTPRELDDLAGALGREAILADPVAFALRRLRAGKEYLAPCYRRTLVGDQPPRDELEPRRALDPALLDAPLLSSLEGSPRLRSSAWGAARLGLLGLDALVYPVTLLLPFLALVAAALAGARERLLVACGAALLALTAVGNVAEVRYALPTWPLFAVAVGLALGRLPAPATTGADGRIAP